MSRTLTIRLSRPALRQVQARARSLGISASELVRRLVVESTSNDVAECSAYDLTRGWIGSVSSPKIPSGRDTRTALEDWQPDRRG